MAARRRGGNVPSRWQQESEEDVFGAAASTGINFDKYDDIPVEVKGDNVPECVVFSSFLLENLVFSRSRKAKEYLSQAH